MTPNQIRGYANNLKGSINADTTGAEVKIDLTTAQAIHAILVALSSRAAAPVRRFSLQEYDGGIYMKPDPNGFWTPISDLRPHHPTRRRGHAG